MEAKGHATKEKAPTTPPLLCVYLRNNYADTGSDQAVCPGLRKGGAPACKGNVCQRDDAASQQKLDTMKMSVGAICLTTFDSNEKLVIATAIQLYTLDLLEIPSHAGDEKKLRQCRQIMQFVLDTRKGPEW